MVEFSALIKKFGKQGEKTGWTYIEIPAAVASKLKPGNKKTFRVKVNLDNFSFKGLALAPMGNGDFILPLNATIRKKIRKSKGDKVRVIMETDKPPELNRELMECLAEDAESSSFFNTLTPGHQRYFSTWINNAKTEHTKTKRIAQTLNALSRHQNFGEMLRAISNENKNLRS